VRRRIRAKKFLIARHILPKSVLCSVERLSITLLLVSGEIVAVWKREAFLEEFSIVFSAKLLLLSAESVILLLESVSPRSLDSTTAIILADGEMLSFIFSTLYTVATVPLCPIDNGIFECKKTTL